MSGFGNPNEYVFAGGGGNYGGISDSMAQTDEQGNTTFVPIYRTGAMNDIVRHDFAELLRKLLLRIIPKHDMRTELFTHGLKAPPETTDELIAGEGTQTLSTRPQNLPFAQDPAYTGNRNPRRSLRVSR